MLYFSMTKTNINHKSIESHGIRGGPFLSQTDKTHLYPPEIKAVFISNDS